MLFCAIMRCLHCALRHIIWENNPKYAIIIPAYLWLDLCKKDGSLSLRKVNVMTGRWGCGSMWLILNGGANWQQRQVTEVETFRGVTLQVTRFHVASQRQNEKIVYVSRGCVTVGLCGDDVIAHTGTGVAHWLSRV